MEVKLEDLIEKIKKEGVEEAQKKSEEIIEEAKKQGSSIISQNQKRAEKIVDDAKRQAERFQKNAELAVQQAARDTEILLKEKIIELFDRVFKKQVSEALTPEFLGELIASITEKWANDPNVEISVSEKDKDRLEALLFSSLGAELKNTVTLKTDNTVANGFRIGLKDGQAYYDFSDQSISNTLKSFLNPRIRAILDQNNG